MTESIKEVLNSPIGTMTIAIFIVGGIIAIIKAIFK